MKKQNNKNNGEEVKDLKDQSPINDEEKIIDIQDVNDKSESEEQISDMSEQEEPEDIIEINERLNAEVQNLKESLLRRAAELENYKKRTETEISEIIKYAAKDFILAIISVYDDFHRSLDHVKDAKDISAIKSGMQLVYDKFSKALKDQGVEKMNAKGKEFDFNLHDALMQQPTNDFPSDIVLEEVEPGYLYKDKVIKHAKVVVSQAAQENKEENS